MTFFLCLIIVFLVARIIYLMESIRALEYEIDQLYLQTVGDKHKGNTMANDPLVELASIKSGYETLVSKVSDLTAALAAAQAANPTSDFVTSDVQATLDALNAEVAAQQAPTPAPSAPTS